MFPSVHGVVSQIGAAADAWYLAGGAPVPLAAYQPINAASLAASYVNLVNPGTFDAAPGVAPTWNAVTGWGFNGSTQYLTTGIVGHNQAWAYAIRFSDPANGGQIFGALESGRFWGIRPRATTNTSRIYYGGFADLDRVDGGVYAQAAEARYRNGASDGSFSATTFTGTTALEIGRAIGAATLFGAVNIQAVAIYATSTDHATWMPEVMAAAAAL